MRWFLFALALSACTSEEATDPGESIDSEALASGEYLYTLNCSECHGEDGLGTVSNGPDLSKRVDDMNRNEIIDTILNGAGFMGPVDLSRDEAGQVADYLLAIF